MSNDTVLVPRIATDAMLDAVLMAEDNADGPLGWDEAYAAMIAAAPQEQPAEPVLNGMEQAFSSEAMSRRDERQGLPASRQPAAPLQRSMFSREVDYEKALAREAIFRAEDEKSRIACEAKQGRQVVPRDEPVGAAVVLMYGTGELGEATVKLTESFEARLNAQPGVPINLYTRSIDPQEAMRLANECMKEARWVGVVAQTHGSESDLHRANWKASDARAALARYLGAK